MGIKELEKIRHLYLETTYREMENEGIRRHKKHQILIAKSVKEYLEDLKAQLAANSSDDGSNKSS